MNFLSSSFLLQFSTHNLCWNSTRHHTTPSTYTQTVHLAPRRLEIEDTRIYGRRLYLTDIYNDSLKWKPFNGSWINGECTCNRISSEGKWANFNQVQPLASALYFLLTHKLPSIINDCSCSCSFFIFFHHHRDVVCNHRHVPNDNKNEFSSVADEQQ